MLLGIQRIVLEYLILQQHLVVLVLIPTFLRFHLKKILEDEFLMQLPIGLIEIEQCTLITQDLITKVGDF